MQVNINVIFDTIAGHAEAFVTIAALNKDGRNEDNYRQ